LKHLDFRAIATSSAGFAFTAGLPDTDWAVSRDTMLLHIREMVLATDLPVNADFESGYAHEPEPLAANVDLCAKTGVAGLSIEDATGDKDKPLYDLDHAVARIRAARGAIDAIQADVVLTARAECFLVGRPDLDDTIRRLTAYAEAGADCLYAPGIRTAEEISAIVKAVAPKPVNVLVGSDFTTVIELAGIGVRRISVGGALARAAWGAFLQAAREIAEHGTFTHLARAIPFADIDGSFRSE
jgi:2-methylisocitrate lyase-like PEP mutase family enzyme